MAKPVVLSYDFNVGGPARQIHVIWYSSGAHDFDVAGFRVNGGLLGQTVADTRDAIYYAHSREHRWTFADVCDIFTPETIACMITAHSLSYSAPEVERILNHKRMTFGYKEGVGWCRLSA